MTTDLHSGYTRIGRFVVLGLSAAWVISAAIAVGAETAVARTDDEKTAVQPLLQQALGDVDPLRRQALERELHTHFHMDLRRVATLAAENRMEAAEWLEELMHQAAEMLEAKEERPEIYDQMARMRRAANTADELAEKLRTAPDEQREELTAKMREALAAYFDLKQEAIGRQIRMMENELAHMKRVYEKRAEQRDRMIERRMHQLVDRDDELEW